jgi:glycosyltransferase involved in cell wall biosynthesis
VLLTDQASLQRLRDAGRWHNLDGVVALALGPRPASSRAGILRLTIALLGATLGRGLDVVHICLPTPSYVPYVALLTALPRACRPRVAITVIDCTLAPNLATNAPADLYEQQVMDAHRLYFKWTRLDAVYSWYQSFVDAAKSLRLLPDRTTVTPARHCFTDPARFQPAVKENVVIFSGRLSTQKRPLLFVDAIASLRRRHAALVAGWRFVMYGGGVLEPEVRARIAEHGLGDVLTLSRAPDLAPVFARTRLFVSTQAFENFTSLAMLEAMAAGNAVIAEDVGQTREFVRPGENGFLVSPASVDGFADAIAEYIRRPELSAPMATVSRAMATKVHTIENFAADITAFWNRLARE